MNAGGDPTEDRALSVDKFEDAGEDERSESVDGLLNPAEASDGGVDESKTENRYNDR